MIVPRARGAGARSLARERGCSPHAPVVCSIAMPILDTPRVPIHYRVDGPERAPVILLASSLGASLGLWDGVVPHLARQLRVVRYDYRGHGGSPATPGPYALADLGGDALALLDGLGVARASVCGISLGGLVAMWLAVHARARVDRLVPACTAAAFGPPAAFHARAAAVREAGIAPLLDGFAARWFTPRFAEQHAGEVARVLGLVAAVDREGYAGCCEAIAQADLSGELASITAPTRVLAGSDDATATPAAVLALAAAIPGATVTALAAAHLACVEQPERFAAAVLEHVTGAGGADGAGGGPASSR